MPYFVPFIDLNILFISCSEICISIVMRQKKAKRVIGRREKADFPELGLSEIDAKIDTGAYTSAIHCHDVEIFEQDGEQRVRFKLLDPNHKAYNHKSFETRVHKIKKIKSSSGQAQMRCIIKTKINFTDKPFEIELSLADRSAMEYPVLIGRKALVGRFVVDVSQLNSIHKEKNKS